MRIKKGFCLHKMGNECIVIQDGVSVVNFHKVLSLNSSAVLLWEEIENGEFDVDKVKQILTEQYEVTEELAGKDAKEFVEKLQELGITEE